MVNTNISKSEKIVANTRVEKIVSKFEPPSAIDICNLISVMIMHNK